MRDWWVPGSFYKIEEHPHLWYECRLLCQKNLVSTLKALFPETWNTFQFDGLHGEMIGKLNEAEDLHIEVPRDHRKTTLLIAWMIRRLLQDKNRRIIYASKTLDLATDVSKSVRRFFGSKFIENYFPEYFMAPGQQYGDSDAWRSPARDSAHIVSPTFRAYGLGNTIAGHRADDVVVDDPVDRGSCNTPKAISDSMTWITDLYQLMESPEHYDSGQPVGRKILTMTPWHYDDVGARVLKTKSYVHFIRHAMENRSKLCTECGENALPHYAFDEENGVPIFPKLWDRPLLEKRREELKADPDAGLDTWYCQYGVLRRNPSAARFRSDWFIRQKPPNIRGMKGFVTGDSAWKDTSMPGVGDFSWFWECAQDRNGVTWVIDAFRSNRMTAKQGADAICAMLVDLRQKGASATLVYQKSGEMSWPTDVASECRRQRIPYVELPITVSGWGAKSKFDRGLRMAGPAERGQIVICDSVPDDLYKIFIDEIIHAPRWPNDDGWDGLSNLFDPKVRRLATPEKEVRVTTIHPWGPLSDDPPEPPRRTRYCGNF